MVKSYNERVNNFCLLLLSTTIDLIGLIFFYDYDLSSFYLSDAMKQAAVKDYFPVLDCSTFSCRADVG